MMSFTMEINLSLLSLNSQQLSAHIIPRSACSLSCCPATVTPQLFFNFPQHILGHTLPQHWGLHASLANASRTPEFRLARGATNILHFCDCPWNFVQVRNFDTTEGLATLGHHHDGGFEQVRFYPHDILWRFGCPVFFWYLAPHDILASFVPSPHH